MAERGQYKGGEFVTDNGKPGAEGHRIQSRMAERNRWIFENSKNPGLSGNRRVAAIIARPSYDFKRASGYQR